MENPPSIVQPTDLATPPTVTAIAERFSAKENVFDNVIQMAPYTRPMLSAGQAMTGFMFMPFLAWASLTASYLRFFDVADSDHKA